MSKASVATEDHAPSKNGTMIPLAYILVTNKMPFASESLVGSTTLKGLLPKPA